MTRGIEDNTRLGRFRLGESLGSHTQQTPENQRTCPGHIAEPASSFTVKSGTSMRSFEISSVALFEASTRDRPHHNRMDQNQYGMTFPPRPRHRHGSLSSRIHKAQPDFGLTAPSYDFTAVPISPPSSTTSKTPHLWQDEFYRDLPKIEPLNVAEACKGSLQVVLADRERELDELRAELRNLWTVVHAKDRQLDQMKAELERRGKTASGCPRCRFLDGDEQIE